MRFFISRATGMMTVRTYSIVYTSPKNWSVTLSVNTTPQGIPSATIVTMFLITLIIILKSLRNVARPKHCRTTYHSGRSCWLSLP